MTEEQSERVVEIRRFMLAHTVSQEVLDYADGRALSHIERNLRRDLLESMDRQGFEPYGPVILTIHRDNDWFLRPYRRTWLEWLLRRPLRYPTPMHTLRAEARAVPKGTL